MRRLLSLLLLISSLSGCNGPDSQKTVPKPQAWPRIETYPQSYRHLSDYSVDFQVNNSVVKTASERKEWITLEYPRYGARLFLTTVKAKDSANLEDILDNRAERMALNIGGASGDLTTLVSEGGFSCRLLTSPSAISTPLQFVAVKDLDVLTGVVFMATTSRPVDADSVAPIVMALQHDIIYGLKHLK